MSKDKKGNYKMKKYNVIHWTKEKEYKVVSVEPIESVEESRKVLWGFGSVLLLEFILKD